MIVVRVELWSARTGKISQLGLMKIGNVADRGAKADYHGEILRKPSFNQIAREGEVKNHRKHDEVVWCLIGKMLTAMGYA